MRKILELRTKFGEIGIPSIEFDIHSIDEIPKVLRGLQSIYCDIVPVRKLIYAYIFEG